MHGNALSQLYANRYGFNIYQGNINMVNKKGV